MEGQGGIKMGSMSSPELEFSHDTGLITFNLIKKRTTGSLMARSGLVLSFTSGLKARVSNSTALLWERLLSQPGLGRENNLLTTHLGQHFIFSHEGLLALL